MDITQLQTDDTLREKGTWITYGDAKFLIRSTDSRQYRRAIMQHAKGKGGRATKEAESLHEMSIEALADAILLDWENVKENGVPLACTRENKLKVLKIAPIREFIAGEAQDIEAFRKEAEAEDAEAIKSGD